MDIKTQAKYWKYAAWTLPFVALAAIVFAFWIGDDTLLAKFIIIICTIFFSISVFWWWWALDKFTQLIKEKLGLEKKLEFFADEIRAIRKDISKK
jgi:hypothetical protein